MIQARLLPSPRAALTALASPMLLSLSLLLLQSPPTTSAASTPTYYRENLFNVCPKNGGKKELNLRTTSAIFTLEVPPSGLLGRDFNCHLELEAPNDNYGFHVFMEEMNFLGEEAQRENEEDCPKDYIQFARDDFVFTTYKSPKFCGKRPRLNATDETSVHKSYDGRKIRFYVEEKDREMDFLIRLDGQTAAPRNLTIVVTVFKKACQSTDRRYVECPHSKRCIRRELMCDTLTNCAWPNGDVPYDEVRCDEYNSAHSSEVFSPANIPVIIVVVIVALGVLIVFAVAMRTFYRSVYKAPEPSEDGGGSRRRSFGRRVRGNAAPPSNSMEAAPLRQTSTTSAAPSAPPSATLPSAPETTELPSAPPKYEEVVGDDPPPYTERA